MAIFQKRPFQPTSQANTIASRYRVLLSRHPFALFGLPFLATMVAGSFFLTPTTAIRYERHDRKVRRLTKDEELDLHKNGRKVNMKDEYYRLMAKDLDNWEQKRVKRLAGEPDGVA